MTTNPNTRQRVFEVFVKVGITIAVFGWLVLDRDSHWIRAWEEWFPDRLSTVAPRDATRAWQPMWGDVFIAPLPKEGAPWSFDQVEVRQGVVFDESSRMDPPYGFRRGAWADVTMREGGTSCLVRLAPARRWEGALQFTSASADPYSLRMQVHAPWKDSGLRPESFSWLQLGWQLPLFAMYLYWLLLGRLTRKAARASASPTE